MSLTSVVDAAPEVSAPIRFEGQSNSEILFNWLTVKRKLWMLRELQTSDHGESDYA